MLLMIKNSTTKLISMFCSCTLKMLPPVYCLFEITKCSDIDKILNPSQTININTKTHDNNCNLSNKKEKAKNNQSIINMLHRNILRICKPTIKREINNTSQETTNIIPQQIPITRNETQSNSLVYKIQKYFLISLFSKKLKERLSCFYELPKAFKILSSELLPNKQGLLSKQLPAPKKTQANTKETNKKEENKNSFYRRKSRNYSVVKQFSDKKPNYFAPKYLTEN